MKVRSRETYWLLKNGLYASYPSLRHDHACDVLIVGGGITGSLMAYQFAQEGYKTILIDKRDISMGSTSATTALLQYEIDEPLFSLIENVGYDAAVDSYLGGIAAIERLGEIVSTLEIDCEFEYKRSVFVAHDTRSKNKLIRELDSRLNAGIKVRWLSGTELHEEFNVVGKAAILSEVAASADGYRLAHGLLAYASKNYDLEIFDHTAFESIKHDGQRSYVKTENECAITTRHIIYATGYETQGMLKDKIVDLISTYALVSEPLNVMPPHLKNTMFWNTEDPYLYMRTTPDNRILVGGGDESFQNAAKRDRLIDKKETLLMKKFSKFMPGVEIIPDFTWAGTFGTTKDALPYMGAHPDYPNSYFMLGFGGNGMTFSVMGMQILSDALAGRPNKFLHYYRFRR